MAELLHLLKRAGLNEYESKAYGALLELNAATAAEISKKAEIPRARVYDVLVGLEKKGFLLQEATRPIRFKPFHPETALANLEKARRQDFSAELASLGDLKGELSMHANAMKKPEAAAGETAFLITGTTNILAKAQELLKSAKEEALICTNEQNALKKAGFLKRILKESPLKARLRFYSPSTIDLKQNFPELAGVEFARNERACRMMVFDNSKALVFLNEATKENEKALLIESGNFARYLKETIR